MVWQDNKTGEVALNLIFEVTACHFKKLGAVLARHRGEEEHIEVRHLFQRLSLLLMRGNASLLVNRVPGEDEVDADVDGVE